MALLPDYLRSGLTVVFVGTSVSTISAAHGHYYSNSSNKFWSLLAATGLVGTQVLGPTDDVRVNEFGVGLTDIVKARAESSDAKLKKIDFDVAGFIAKIEKYRPRIVAFNGGMAAKVVAQHLGKSLPGAAAVIEWRIGDARVYRLPSSSGAAAIGTAVKQLAWKEFGAWARGVET